MQLADLKARMHAVAARLCGAPRVLVFGCSHAAPLRALESDNVAVIELICAAQLPPSFLDYVLSRRLADGIVMTGCPPGNCHYRLGNHWTVQRLARERDPRLRSRVPPERLAVVWAGGAEIARLRAEIQDFVRRLAALPPLVPTVGHAQAPLLGVPARPLAPTEAGDD
jgi:coenzyme F420-reducing hydrogenase delta subunit